MSLKSGSRVAPLQSDPESQEGKAGNGADMNRSTPITNKDSQWPQDNDRQSTQGVVGRGHVKGLAGARHRTSKLVLRDALEDAYEYYGLTQLIWFFFYGILMIMSLVYHWYVVFTCMYGTSPRARSRCYLENIAF